MSRNRTDTAVLDSNRKKRVGVWDTEGTPSSWLPIFCLRLSLHSSTSDLQVWSVKRTHSQQGTPHARGKWHTHTHTCTVLLSGFAPSWLNKIRTRLAEIILIHPDFNHESKSSNKRTWELVRPTEHFNYSAKLCVKKLKWLWVRRFEIASFYSNSADWWTVRVNVCVGCEEEKRCSHDWGARLQSLDRCSVSDVGQLWGAFPSL